MMCLKQRLRSGQLLFCLSSADRSACRPCAWRALLCSVSRYDSLEGLLATWISVRACAVHHVDMGSLSLLSKHQAILMVAYCAGAKWGCVSCHRQGWSVLWLQAWTSGLLVHWISFQHCSTSTVHRICDDHLGGDGTVMEPSTRRLWQNCRLLVVSLCHHCSARTVYLEEGNWGVCLSFQKCTLADPPGGIGLALFS